MFQVKQILNYSHYYSDPHCGNGSGLHDKNTSVRNFFTNICVHAHVLKSKYTEVIISSSFLREYLMRVATDYGFIPRKYSVGISVSE